MEERLVTKLMFDDPAKILRWAARVIDQAGVARRPYAASGRLQRTALLYSRPSSQVNTHSTIRNSKT